MLKNRFDSEVGESPEFSSAVLRLAGWLLMASLLGVGGYVGHYQVNWTAYVVLFGLHLAWFVAILVSTFRRPDLDVQRTYMGILADLSGTSFSLYLSGDPTSPFYLIYVWSYLSQGMRFGKNNLILSALGSVFCFVIVSSILDGWHASFFEIAFIILSLVVLPWYQYVLLRRLHEAKTAAEQANKAKSSFLATITHELRTPLSGVIGMTRLLDSTRLDDEQRDYVESLGSSANMLQALIGDILDLSKIEARKLELKPEFFDIRRSITEVMVALSNPALDKGVEMIVDVSPDVPEKVYGDPLRFRQVLFNLVGNAVKFTERGRVLVEARIGEPNANLWKPHLVIAVKDTGVGIPAGDLGKVFENFWQADDSSTRSRGGTGLGTAISRDLTRLMKGDIGVESVEGRGTTFWVRLPFLKNAGSESIPSVPTGLQGQSVLLLDTHPESLAVLERACRAVGMRHVSVSEVDRLTRTLGEQTAGIDLAVLADSPQGLDLEGLAVLVERLTGRDLPIVFLHYPRRALHPASANKTGLIKPFAATAFWEAMLRVGGERQRVSGEPSHLLNAVPQGEGARVLVAEDDSINAKLIQSLLAKGGHEVVMVRDGQHALEEALKGGFDLALVDLRMPQMDGMDFTRNYRAREQQGVHLPIVALTANAAEDARDECLEAGMDDFLTKPVDPQLLDHLLRRYRRSA